MLSTICSTKQKSLQMCAELRHCQRWVMNRERQRVPQWRTRDGKTSLSVGRRSGSRYRQIAACCGTEMTSASGGRNRVAHHCKSWRCVTLSGFLQSHSSLSVKLHFLWHVLQWPWPVRKRFSSDHWRRWRSKPGSWILGSTTKVELTTIADCQSSLHRLLASIVCKSLHNGLHDSRRSGGGWKMSSYNGQSQWHSAWFNLSVAALHHRAGSYGWCQRWGTWRNAVGHLQG